MPAETAGNEAHSPRHVVERYLETFNSGDLDAALARYAENSINHGYPVTRARIRTVLEDIKTRFPNARLTPQQFIEQGEWVVVRAMYSGTHQGTGTLPVDGGMLIGVAPTGKSFEAQTIHMFRVVDGAIVEHRASRDDLEMMRQLGLLPRPAFP